MRYPKKRIADRYLPKRTHVEVPQTITLSFFAALCARTALPTLGGKIIAPIYETLRRRQPASASLFSSFSFLFTFFFVFPDSRFSSPLPVSVVDAFRRSPGKFAFRGSTDREALLGGLHTLSE